jgi:hypothetical protein
MAAKLIERQSADITRLEDENQRLKADLRMDRISQRKRDDAAARPKPPPLQQQSPPGPPVQMPPGMQMPQQMQHMPIDNTATQRAAAAEQLGLAEKLLAGKDEDIGALTCRVRVLGTERDQQTAAAERAGQQLGEAKTEISRLRTLLRASEIREKKLK